MQTVAVDFDGVIHAYSKGWHDGTVYDEPVPGAVEALRTLMDTYAVFIHTARDIPQVSGWLTSRGFTCWTESFPGIIAPEFWSRQGVLLVTNRKLPALCYIDDRAIEFRDWDQALAAVPRFAPLI